MPSGKTGVVYDVFLKLKDEGKFRSYCKRGFLTETEALKHELGMKSEFIERAKKKDGYQCLDEYLKQWLSNGKAVSRWSLNTLSGYEVNIRKHILPVCGHYRLNEINPERCDQILRRMKFQGLSDSTMREVSIYMIFLVMNLEKRLREIIFLFCRWLSAQQLAFTQEKSGLIQQPLDKTKKSLLKI